MPANKAQVIIYNELLGIAQGYKPRYCYILGRGWKYTKKNETFSCNRFDERLGVIDTKGVDKYYIDKIHKALDWLTNVRKNAKKWTYNPPSVPELYPNMCNKYDNNKEKYAIASEIEEITQLWNCGVKQREQAHKNGVYKISDPKLTTDIMGLPKGTKRTIIIDKMLKFNQGIIYHDQYVIPNYINNNPYNWKNDVRIEFYLDFEILSNIFDDFNSFPNMNGPNKDVEDPSIVFMCGLGISIKSENNTKWEYYNFRITELKDQYEFQMFNDMYKKINEKCKKYKIDIKNANIYHWGSIEQTIVSKLYNKYENIHNWENLCLIDFCKIFQDENILIKGVYNFKLKSIGKALIKYGLINIPNWKDNVVDGLDAMIQAYDIYNNPNKNHKIITHNLINYNHTDVRMIHKIIEYLRNNHTDKL